jgi:hypothetical protein
VHGLVGDIQFPSKLKPPTSAIPVEVDIAQMLPSQRKHASIQVKGRLPLRCARNSQQLASCAHVLALLLDPPRPNGEGRDREGGSV